MLYSLIFELTPRWQAVLPLTMGHLAHAFFLNLVKQFDPLLSARLHNEPTYHPYTISPLLGQDGIKGESRILHRGQPCLLRITLFDGGHLWTALQSHFLKTRPISVQLGGADFHLTRILSTPESDTSGWVSSTDFQTLATLPIEQAITFSFCSPTAFSLSHHQFCLFPEPHLVWGSLLRAWNNYAPETLKMSKQKIQEGVKTIQMVSCQLETAFLRFPNHTQKGFLGQCTYQIEGDHSLLASLITLAAFAHYAGIGYTTTMGMGRVRAAFEGVSRNQYIGKQSEEEEKSDKNDKSPQH